MLRWVVVFVFLALGLRAEPVSPDLLERLRKDPGPFLTLAEDLIHGYGADGAIDAAGVDRFVALERAEAWATALKRLQVADMDQDGAVLRPEMAVLVDSVAAKARGKLWRLFAEADLDRDDRIAPEELMAWGRAAAEEDFPAKDESLARSVLLFDGDSDGRVSLVELRASLEALGI